MIGLIISAGILGLIISLMEEGDFPGWTSMIICVIAAIVPMFILQMLLPPSLAILGSVVGAICCMVAISATCGMTVKRAGIAAGVYFACQVALSFGLSLLFG